MLMSKMSRCFTLKHTSTTKEAGRKKLLSTILFFFIIECHLVPSNRKINNLYLMPITSLNKQEHGSYVLY